MKGSIIMQMKNVVQIFAVAAIIMGLSAECINAQQICNDDCWTACNNLSESSFEYCMSLCCEI
jgi:hypothetical protein